MARRKCLAIFPYFIRSILVSRAPSNFRQQDVARAIKAAKGSGLDIMRVEIDPKTSKITLVVKEDKNDDSTRVSEWATASTDWALPKRKLKRRPL
jgi:hypothetical protein